MLVANAQAKRPGRLDAFEAWLPTSWNNQRIVAGMRAAERDDLYRVLCALNWDELTPVGFNNWCCRVGPEVRGSTKIHEVIFCFLQARGRIVGGGE